MSSNLKKEIAELFAGWFNDDLKYKIRTAEKIKHIQRICHGLALKSGWWKPEDTQDPKTFAVKLCLIHSEISEAMEGDRKGLKDDHLPQRDMREVELADAVIRIFDLAGAYDMDLGGAIVEKLTYNQQRADHKLENRAKEGGKAY